MKRRKLSWSELKWLTEKVGELFYETAEATHTKKGILISFGSIKKGLIRYTAFFKKVDFNLKNLKWFISRIEAEQETYSNKK